jgi:IS30 family transposase
MAFIFSAAGESQIPQKQGAQQRRIRQGVASGELTRKEAIKLEREQGRINREIQRDRLDGGGLTATERKKANRKLNRSSTKIYREKHDPQKR